MHPVFLCPGLSKQGDRRESGSKSPVVPTEFFEPRIDASSKVQRHYRARQSDPLHVRSRPRVSGSTERDIEYWPDMLLPIDHAALISDVGQYLGLLRSDGDALSCVGP